MNIECLLYLKCLDHGIGLPVKYLEHLVEPIEIFLAPVDPLGQVQHLGHEIGPLSLPLLDALSDLAPDILELLVETGHLVRELHIEILDELMVLLNGLLPVQRDLLPEEVSAIPRILHLHLQLLDHRQTLKHETVRVLHRKLGLCLQHYCWRLLLLESLVLLLKLIVQLSVHWRELQHVT